MKNPVEASLLKIALTTFRLLGMDVLSLTANMLAVVSAASTATAELKNLYRLSRAPEELLQFQNEVSALII